MRRAPRLLLSATCTVTSVVSIGAQTAPLAFVDAHTHLMVENLTPDEEIALLKKAGIARVVLMHTEPGALAALARQHPGFVIPSLSFTRATANSMKLDENVVPLVGKLIADHAICSVGEIGGGNFSASSEPVRATIALA